MSDNLPAAAPPRRPWRRVFYTVLASVGVGPPAGAVFFTLAIMFYLPFSKPASSDNSIASSLLGSIFVLPFAVLFSFVLGGLQAIGTGLVFAAYGWRFKRVPLWLAVGAGTVMFGLFMLVTGVDDTSILPLYFATHVVAALACWLIVRNFWRG
jgi:hypothetical protein